MESEDWFIGGKFFDYEIPKEKRYLYKYFRSPAQKQFVKYFLMFGNTTRFVDHTGFQCSYRFLRMCKNKLKRLEIAKEKARSNLDFDTISKIETGKYRL